MHRCCRRSHVALAGNGRNLPVQRHPRRSPRPRHQGHAWRPLGQGYARRGPRRTRPAACHTLVIGEAETRVAELLNDPVRRGDLPGVACRPGDENPGHRRRHRLRPPPSTRHRRVAARDARLPRPRPRVINGRQQANMVGARGCPDNCFSGSPSARRSSANDTIKPLGCGGRIADGVGATAQPSGLGIWPEDNYELAAL